MQVKVRRVRPQQVLSITASVRVGQIDDHIEAASQRLADLAPAAGAVFVIYHGEVSEQQANPVEVCLPVATTAGVGRHDDVIVREEAEHVEAYVTITKAQTDYPEIMGAYGTVDEWVSDHQVEVCGSPREVYFADFATATLHDLVCDVAFPIQGYRDPDPMEAVPVAEPGPPD